MVQLRGKMKLPLGHFGGPCAVEPRQQKGYVLAGVIVLVTKGNGVVLQMQTRRSVF